MLAYAHAAPGRRNAMVEYLEVGMRLHAMCWEDGGLVSCCHMLSWHQARFLAGRSKPEAVLGKYYPAAVTNINPKRKKAPVKVRRPNGQKKRLPSLPLPAGPLPLRGGGRCLVALGLKSKGPRFQRALNRFQSCLRVSSGGFDQARHDTAQSQGTRTGFHSEPR